MKNICIDKELELPMYNVHPYFSLTNLGKKCTLYKAKYGNYGTCSVTPACKTAGIQTYACLCQVHVLHFGGISTTTVISSKLFLTTLSYLKIS